MSPRNLSARQRGFTLVELLVVAMIMAILAAVATIPSSVDSAAADLDLAELQVQDAFAMAQTMSYSLGVPHGVVFDPDTERFAVVAQDGEAVQDPLTHGKYEIDFRHIEQPRGVSIYAVDFGDTGVAGIMDGQGVPVVGGSVVLAKGDVTRTLVLDPATGKLSAEDE